MHGNHESDFTYLHLSGWSNLGFGGHAVADGCLDGARFERPNVPFIFVGSLGGFVEWFRGRFRDVIRCIKGPTPRLGPLAFCFCFLRGFVEPGRGNSRGFEGSFEDAFLWSLGLLSAAFLQAWLAGQRALALGNGRLDLDRWTGTATTVFPALGLGLCYALNSSPSIGLYLGVLVASLLLVTALVALQSRAMEGANNEASLRLEEEFRESRSLLGLLWSKNRWTASANLAQFMVYRLQYGVLLVGWGRPRWGFIRWPWWQPKPCG